MLVQCWGGVNRAPSLAVALLTWVQHVHVVSAVEMVMAVRGEILTNRSFRAQLIQEAMEHDLLPDYGLRTRFVRTEIGPHTWETHVPEELLELVWVSVARGTGLRQPDAVGKNLWTYIREAAGRRKWPEHARLLRRLTLLRGLIRAACPKESFLVSSGG